MLEYKLNAAVRLQLTNEVFREGKTESEDKGLKTPLLHIQIGPRIGPVFLALAHMNHPWNPLSQPAHGLLLQCPCLFGKSLALY